MIICLDIRALQIGHENRGIGMYIKSVLEHLPANDNKYILYAFDKNDPIKHLGIKVPFHYQLVQTPTVKTVLNSPSDIFGLIKLVNHSFHKLKTIKPDIFVQFDFTLGIPNWSKTKTIVIGYDLIPLMMKNEYLPSVSFALRHTGKIRARTVLGLLRSMVYRMIHLSFSPKGKSVIGVKLRMVTRSIYYRLKYRLHYKTYKRADHIICISKATSRCFVKLLGINKSKITVIPLAPISSNTTTDNSIVEKINKPYVYYIGGVDSRKSITDIIRAFNIAKGRGADIALVLAGNEFREVKNIPDISGRNAILASPYKTDIHLVGFASDPQKLGLYRSAHAFIFCTTYEGFGLPIVEAMSASCPVISYNNSSIPEAAGDAALLVETGDYVAVANNILLLQDEKLRQKLILRGIEQTKKFSWSKTARQMLQAIEKA